tara:strand:+ start:214 stop:1212 length:999 start_codon:yes stop_codon:yes gene_type:complete
MIKSITISPYKKDSDMGQKSRFLIGELSDYDKIFNTNCSIYEQDNNYGVFEESSVDNPDCCIQYVRFTDFIRTQYKNIGIFEPSFKDVSQQENYLKLLDAIVVRSDAQKDILPDSVKEKVSVVKPSIDKIPRQSPMKKLGGKLSFYISSIGEYSNLDIALTAYLREFTVNDNVVLNIFDLNPEALGKYVEDSKNRLTMYGKTSLYPDIAAYDNPSIHQQSDCFIDISMNYEISLQTITAASLSNPIVSCNHNGLMQWLHKDYCYLVNAYEGSRNSHPIGNIPDSLSLSRTMRRVYENKSEFNSKQAMMLDAGYKSFYYTQKESIGEAICSLY